MTWVIALTLVERIAGMEDEAKCCFGDGMNVGQCSFPLYCMIVFCF